jgi:hypothetical protein
MTSADDLFREVADVDPLDPGELPMLMVGAVICGRCDSARVVTALAVDPRHVVVIEAMRAAASAGHRVDVVTIGGALAEMGAMAARWGGPGRWLEWWTDTDAAWRSIGIDVDATIGELRFLAILRKFRDFSIRAAAAAERQDYADLCAQLVEACRWARYLDRIAVAGVEVAA